VRTSKRGKNGTASVNGFFDQKVQKTTGKNNRTIYKMNNETGEGIITQYIILPGIQFFITIFT